MSLSPRNSCRLDEHARHDYSGGPLPSSPPNAPWALYLTDQHRQFRLIALDFDDHTGTMAAAVAADVALTAHLLDQADIDYLVCASGSGGGRHLWIHCEPTSPVIVDRIRLALLELTSTLDTGALINTRSGCVRAPGSLHRAGGRSIPLARDGHSSGEQTLEHLAAHPAPSTLLAEFADLLVGIVGPRVVHDPTGTPTPTPTSGTASSSTSSPLTYLRSALDTDPSPAVADARPLAPFVQQMLESPPTSDQSVGAFTIARGYVIAGRTVDDFVHAALHQRAPGLEHIRTRRISPHSDDRVPRHNAERVARRQFAHAQATVALSPPSTRPQPQSVAHAIRIAHTAVHIAATTARWSGPSGAVRLRTLAGLAHLTITRRRRTVTGDTRTLAVTTGLTSAQVSTALRYLNHTGWIEQVHAPVGPLAAQWRLTDLTTHTTVTNSREPVAHFLTTGGEHPPKKRGGTGSPGGEDLITLLATSGADPCFQLPGVGACGHAIWLHLHLRGPLTEGALAGALRLDGRTVVSCIDALEASGLVRRAGGTLVRARDCSEAQEAIQRAGCEQVLVDRQARYRAESASWAIRCAERAWRASSIKKGCPADLNLVRSCAIVDVATVVCPSTHKAVRGELTATVLARARAWCRRLASGVDLTDGERLLLTPPSSDTVALVA